MQTGHFVRTVTYIFETFNAFLTPRRLSIQIVQIHLCWVRFSLCCARALTLWQQQQTSSLQAWALSASAGGLLLHLFVCVLFYVGVNVCLQVAGPPVLHQPPPDSQWQLKTLLWKLSQSHPHRWVDLRQWAQERAGGLKGECYSKRSDTEMQSNWKFLGVIRVLSGSDEDQTVAFTWSKTNDHASGVALCTFWPEVQSIKKQVFPCGNCEKSPSKVLKNKTATDIIEFGRFLILKHIWKTQIYISYIPKCFTTLS